MIKIKEIRKLYKGNLEVRTDKKENEEEQKIIYGYVNKFNENSELLQDRWGDYFIEVISENAFDKSLEKKNQKALWNHNMDKVLGSIEANTLKLETDEIGLKCEIILPNTSFGKDAYETIRRKDVSGMSFGFTCKEEKWTKIKIDEKEVYKRTILEAELYEVSPCVFPAYTTSTVECRSLENFKEEIKSKKLKELLIKTYL